MVSSGRELYACISIQWSIHICCPFYDKISIKNIELNELADSVRAILVQIPPHVPTTNPWAFNSDAKHLSSWRTQSSPCWKWKHVNKITEKDYKYLVVQKKKMRKLLNALCGSKKSIPVKELNYKEIWFEFW